jgi:predicted Zn-dependent peptidase
MNKIELSNLDESIIYEKLSNGLEVYLLPNNNVKNFYMTFNTRYGSIYNNFKKSNESKYHVIPNGVAHFLEHLTFYMDGGDASDYFASIGSSSNAYTGFKITCYNVSGYNNFKDNLNYLLDFVQTPFYNKKQVNDEKGIICEEVKMYEDMPDNVAYFKLLQNVFYNDEIKNPVAGKVSDVKRITLDDILVAYNTFYHPSNMFVCITGNFNPEEALAIISENQDNKKFEPEFSIDIKSKNELPSLVTDMEEIESNVEIEKVSIGIKIPLSKFNNLKLSDEVRNVYINLILNSIFGRSSIVRERLVSGSIMIDGIYYDAIYTDDYLVLNLIAETPYPKRYISIIKESISNIMIDEDELKRKKRVAISSLIASLDSIEMMNDLICDNIIEYNKVIPNYYDIYNDLDLKIVNKISKIITEAPISILILNKSDKS